MDREDTIYELQVEKRLLCDRVDVTEYEYEVPFENGTDCVLWGFCPPKFRREYSFLTIRPLDIESFPQKYYSVPCHFGRGSMKLITKNLDY